jgi:hypothetical protein
VTGAERFITNNPSGSKTITEGEGTCPDGLRGTDRRPGDLEAVAPDPMVDVSGADGNRTHDPLLAKQVL